MNIIDETLKKERPIEVGDIVSVCTLIYAKHINIKSTMCNESLYLGSKNNWDIANAKVSGISKGPNSRV